VKLGLAEKKIDFVEQILDETQLPALHVLNHRDTIPVFVDVDRDRTVMHDSLAILHYIEMYFSAANADGPWLLPALKEQRSAYAQTCERLMESSRILQAVASGDKQELGRELDIWEGHFGKTGGHGFADGSEVYSMADVALFPVVKEVRESGGSAEWARRWPAIEGWVKRMEGRGSVKRTYGGLGVGEGE